MSRVSKIATCLVASALALSLCVKGQSAYAEAEQSEDPIVIEETGEDEDETTPGSVEDEDQQDESEPIASDEPDGEDEDEDEDEPEVIEGSDDEDDPIVDEEPSAPADDDPADTDDEPEVVVPEDDPADEEEPEEEAPSEDDPVPADDLEPADDREDVDELEPAAPVVDEEDDSEPEDSPEEEPTSPEKEDEKDSADAEDEKLAPQSNNVSFSDVPADHWAYKVIKRAAKLGLIMGYSGDREGQFGPDDGITRAQVVTVLWRMAGKPKPGSNAASFSDVKPDAYYYDAVSWASSKGIVYGYSGENAGMFGPADPVTRQQLATMLTNYAKKVSHIDTTSSASSFAAFTDSSSVSDWARDAVAWCFSSGIMSGSNGEICPTNGATRAQAAKMVVGLYDRSAASWQLSVSSSAKAVRQGSQVTVTPSISGNAEGVTYSYTAYLGSWSGSMPSGTITLNKLGPYSLTVKAVDENGVTQTASVAVASYKFSGVTIMTEGTARWIAAPYTGIRGGRINGVEYRYTWNFVDKDGGGVLRDWSSSPTVSFTRATFNNTSSKVRITCEARDAQGSLGSFYKDLMPDAMTMRAQAYSSPTSWLIMVNEATCWVGIYRGYQGNWEQVMYMRCSCGGGGATPKGIFSIGARGYSFGNGYTCYWWTDYYLASYAFHSIKYNEGTFDVQDGRLGYHISAGCIRLALENAKYIYDNVPYDTTVVIYNR